ncbi:MAG: tRNA pseudouridine(38-40) synthase TruA [Clostridium sp.]|uniref:tRNA pseudouridine(38-40) synthase TruA n=1 Tax=Clostridium culturomicium TaxID=1499683 RepID=UPI00058D3E82|nr:tRNA pseudouridine(38-40) synthase TruA [Clostridium culturomicium]MDU4891195.1 tRNA pseudouridine(38-40) synthase TruA [Clostridium sp.]MDU7085422.1 tRNA pseudouridine(38-40) synthase TruA [Clostridium sp.]
MRNIKLTLEYDGTNYLGWQKQPKGITVQGAVEEALSKLTKEEASIIGCSRTDSKVHAKRYVCNFTTKSRIPAESFREALNFHLPEDIAVIDSAEVDESFHARYNCVGKMYSYTIVNTKSRMPMCRNFAYHVKHELNIDRMKEAAEFFVGTHDFEAFRNLGSSVKTTVRTITKLEVVQENEYIKIYIAADGFLYNMVRIIVGTLIDVGIGKKEPSDIKIILESKERKRAGKTCPPQGLCLFEVYY